MTTAALWLLAEGAARAQPPASPAPRAPAADEHAQAWSPTAAWRPAQSEDDERALADLLDVSATVASKNAAAVSTSPGLVTVYSAEDIRRLGDYTIADLADVSAGTSSQVVFGERVLASRGQKAGSFNNNKHLVLVDGIPVNHARGGKAMIDENFPLFFADRLELLRGPASALYGTGAFFGVVNVTPKEADADGLRAEARAGLGSAQLDKRLGTNALYRDRARHAAIFVGLFDKGPSAAYTGPTPNPDNRSWDNQRSEFLYLRYGVDQGALTGLTAGFLYASKNGGLGEHWLGGYSPQYDDLTWTQMIPYLKYQRPLGSGVALTAWAKASRDTEKATAAATPAASSAAPGNLVLLYGSSVASYETQAELRWDPGPAWNVIAGLDGTLAYQNDGAGDYGGFVSSRPGPVFVANTRTLTSGDRFGTASGFLQVAATLPVLAGLHVTTGARLDAGQALDARFAQLSPRAGVVQELTEWLSVKLLFDTALRAPGIKELGLNKEVRPELADPSRAAQVKPETMRSLEGGLALHTAHVSANAAAFVNETRDALDGREEPGADGTPRNLFGNTPGKVVARGVEAELGVAASADARLFANYSFASATLEDAPTGAPGAINLADVPIHRVNAGASYRLRAPVDLTTTLVAKWVTGYRPAPPVPPAPVAPPAPGHLLVDANLITRLTEHGSLELLVRNVGDVRYKLPREGIPYVPMPGRTFHLTYDYRF